MEKWLVTAVLALFFIGNVPAQGIDFFHGSWAEAQEKAKAEQKLIFVDAFASWCGPCKRMAREVFPDAAVGDYFNANFINLKIDMEKPENREFASQYPVRAYPTLMVLDAEGKVVLKQVGAMNTDGLVAFGQKAFGTQDNSKDFEQEYADGKRDPEFLLEYVRALNRANKPSLRITNEYLNTQDNFDTPINRKFILEGAVEADSRVFDLLLANQQKIAIQEGPEAVKSRISMACKNTLKKAIEFRSENLLEESISKMKAGLPERADEFEYDAKMDYYAATKDEKQYLKTVQAYQKKEIKNNAAKLHNLVIRLLRDFPKDDQVLKQAEKWADTAAKNGGLADYYLTLAEVYKRQGDFEKARKAAEKAREAAKENENGMDGKVEYFLRGLGE
ncbi:MAG: thioredoxin [Bacteroidetes bacterium]|nr:MAG: thioredoxin [Bacteroidota bacterium]